MKRVLCISAFCAGPFSRTSSWRTCIGKEPQGWGQLGHQSAGVHGHHHDPTSSQFHCRLYQTFQEHESFLRYPGCVATPKHLMRLMFFNSQPSSACIHSYDLPKWLSSRFHINSFMVSFLEVKLCIHFPQGGVFETCLRQY